MKQRVETGFGTGWLSAVGALAAGMLVASHLAVTPAGAQTSPEELNTQVLPDLEGGIPSLVVNSVPSGAVVILRGPYEWVGVTPWTLTRPVSGLYRVEARRPGYETWKAEVVLGAGSGQTLDITLGRKTVQKALLRSLIIPGWGQMYRGSKGKGSLILGGTVLAGGAFLWTDGDYRGSVDDFDAARGRYERATRLEELNDRWAEVRRASRDADRKWDRRRLALGALGGLYAFNVLDVLFLSPTGEAETSGISDLDGTAPAPRGLGWTASAAPSGDIQAALRWNW